MPLLDDFSLSISLKQTFKNYKTLQPPLKTNVLNIMLPISNANLLSQMRGSPRFSPRTHFLVLQEEFPFVEHSDLWVKYVSTVTSPVTSYYLHYCLFLFSAIVFLITPSFMLNFIVVLWFVQFPKFEFLCFHISIYNLQQFEYE